MSEAELAAVEQVVTSFGGSTPAARLAAELLAEVKRLRALVPPTFPDPLTVDQVAAALRCAPRTVRMWIAQGRLRVGADGRVVGESLLALVRSSGWTREDVAALAARLDAAAVAQAKGGA